MSGYIAARGDSDVAGPGNNAPYVKMATSLSDLHAKMREKLVEMQARRGDGKRKLRKEKAVVRTNTKREATEIEGLKPSEDDLTVKKRVRAFYLVNVIGSERIARTRRVKMKVNMTLRYKPVLMLKRL